MGKYISLTEKDGYQYVTRNIGKDGAVVLIPYKIIQNELKFQLILSHRPTFDKPILEFPAGLLDHADKTRYETAEMELQEETGWSGKIQPNWSSYLPAPSSAGLTDEVLYLMPAILEKQGYNNLQGDEQLDVLPLMSIPELITYIRENTLDIGISKENHKIYVSSRVLAFIAGAELFGGNNIKIQYN